MKIGNFEYPIAGYVNTEFAGRIPMVDLPMMNDYKWYLSCLKSRLENPEIYRTLLGEDVDVVIAQLVETLNSYVRAGRELPEAG